MTDFRKAPDKIPQISTIFLGDILTEDQAARLNSLLGRAFGYETARQTDGSYKVIRKGKRA